MIKKDLMTFWNKNKAHPRKDKNFKLTIQYKLSNEMNLRFLIESVD